MQYQAITLLPIIICFTLIFISKNAFISILAGILSAITILFGQDDTFSIFSLLNVFRSQSTIQTILFILIVGALIKGMESSKGVSGLILYLEHKKINITSPVHVQLFTMLIGMLLFVDATSSMAITAVIGKPLFRKAEISTEKLALIINSTASPIAWLIPFGGAGALMTSLITPIDAVSDNAFQYVVQAVPFQLYTLVLLIILVGSILLGYDIGSIRHIKYVESHTRSPEVYNKGKARNMIVPISSLLVGIALLLYVTGDGNILKGDGSAAVFYSGLFTLLITLVYYRLQNICTIRQCLGWYYEGVKMMLTVTLLLGIALIFSDLLTQVGSAQYLANTFTATSTNFLPLIALLLSGAIAFSTGTSGGTVAIMTGILIPMAILSHVSIPVMLGAIVSGAVFGDQNSIISDSVIMTSSVTGVDAITHVKTQLPYTLIAFGIAALLYLGMGFIL